MFADESPVVQSANIVGYNTTVNTENPSFIFSVSFKDLNENGILPFNDLVCPEEFEMFDTIEVSFTDEEGVTQLDDYSYIAGMWLSPSGLPCTEEDGLTLGQSAWFCSAGDPKNITTSGEVRKEGFIHTFTDPNTLCSSAYPVPFCPNDPNVSWDVSMFDTIEVAYTDEEGVTQLDDYSYIAGMWLNPDGLPCAEDEVVAAPGEGFWLCLQDTESTFAEVSPIADAE